MTALFRRLMKAIRLRRVARQIVRVCERIEHLAALREAAGQQLKNEHHQHVQLNAQAMRIERDLP